MAGKLYIEDQWLYDTVVNDTEAYRGTLAYDLDLGRLFGRHKLAGLIQQERSLYQRRIHVEILTDRNGVPISNAATPEIAANFLYRRNYLTEGNYNTYYAGDIRNPFQQSINGKEYVGRWITRNQTGQNLTKKDSQTWMFVSQSYFLEKRLSVLFGYRSDDVEADRYRAQRLVSADARVIRGERLNNEWEFSPAPTVTDHYEPVTRTLGAVFHLTKNVSAFYNESSNVGEPALNLTLIPDGSSPRPIRGSGSDFGLGFEFFGGRANLRINRYETNGYDTPDGNGAIITGPATRVMDTLLARRVISDAEYQSHLISGTAGLSDGASKGTEVALTANPTNRWALQASYSYNKQSKTNFLTEAEAAFVGEETWWRERLQAAALSPTAVSTSGLSGSQGSIEDEIDRVKTDIRNVRSANELGFGRRPHKASLFTRYSFGPGALSGFMAGGGARYQSQSFNQRDLTTNTDYWGEVVFQVDCLLGYRTKRPIWPGAKPSELSFQLNVYNVLDEKEPLTARLNDQYSGLRRVYLQEPRSFRFTATVSF
jgi:hypothetical protein